MAAALQGAHRPAAAGRGCSVLRRTVAAPVALQRTRRPNRRTILAQPPTLEGSVLRRGADELALGGLGLPVEPFPPVDPLDHLGGNGFGAAAAADGVPALAPHAVGSAICAPAAPASSSTVTNTTSSSDGDGSSSSRSTSNFQSSNSAAWRRREGAHTAAAEAAAAGAAAAAAAAAAAGPLGGPQPPETSTSSSGDDHSVAAVSSISACTAGGVLASSSGGAAVTAGVATPNGDSSSPGFRTRPRRRASQQAASAGASSHEGATDGVVNGALYPPSERSQIQDSWDALMRWSKFFRRQQEGAEESPADAARKVVVFGGGSFGTAMGTSLARKRPDIDVVLLLRDSKLCADINEHHRNTKYLPDFALPPNMRATTDMGEAADAGYAVHAVPVQHSRAFLEGIRDVLPPSVPIVCVSKGLEVGTGCMMSEVIPSALGRRQPATFISGPSFAREVMEGRPTGVVAACRDAKLARQVQALFASPSMRVNTSTDVVGVEICGALKNVLAIAAGIVEGLDLGHNALAALVAQGCAEIRWLAEKLGAKPQTMSGLSGLGDIMLTCYGDLSRNRSVGMRLGRGERLEDILASSSQVAEGVATAGVVVSLARRYRVSLPVLTAVAQVLDNNLTPAQAVAAIMRLPQVEEH